MKKTWISLLVSLFTAVNTQPANYHGQKLKVLDHGSNWIAMSFVAEKCHYYQVIMRDNMGLDPSKFERLYSFQGCKNEVITFHVLGLSTNNHYFRLIDTIVIPCNCL